MSHLLAKRDFPLALQLIIRNFVPSRQTIEKVKKIKNRTIMSKQTSRIFKEMPLIEKLLHQSISDYDPTCDDAID